LGRPPAAAGSRLDPYEPAIRPWESRGARNRLDLERRTLEGRRESIDRDLQRRPSRRVVLRHCGRRARHREEQAKPGRHLQVPVARLTLRGPAVIVSARR
jgi:hypothetical protein